MDPIAHSGQIWYSSRNVHARISLAGRGDGECEQLIYLFLMFYLLGSLSQGLPSTSPCSPTWPQCYYIKLSKIKPKVFYLPPFAFFRLPSLLRSKMYRNR
jgi:hypothetical protein